VRVPTLSSLQVARSPQAPNGLAWAPLTGPSLASHEMYRSGPANHRLRESLPPVRCCFPAANLPASSSISRPRTCARHSTMADCSEKACFGARDSLRQLTLGSGMVHGSAAGSIDFARDTSAVHPGPTVKSWKPGGGQIRLLLSNDVDAMSTHCGSSCSFPSSACPRR
jgi:hypothetical protein